MNVSTNTPRGVSIPTAIAAGAAPVCSRIHCTASCTAAAVCATCACPRICPAASSRQSACASLPQSIPTNHSNVSATAISFLPDRPVSRITLVLALEARLPTGCHSRSTSPGRKSLRGARGAGAEGTPDEVAELATIVLTSRPCGSCRSRGRQERAHRSLENAQNAFPTATTGPPPRSHGR